MTQAYGSNDFFYAGGKFKDVDASKQYALVLHYYNIDEDVKAASVFEGASQEFDLVVAIYSGFELITVYAVKEADCTSNDCRLGSPAGYIVSLNLDAEG